MNNTERPDRKAWAFCHSEERSDVGIRVLSRAVAARYYGLPQRALPSSQ